MFACHKSSPDAAAACAGWLAVAGYSHLGVRLAVAMGRLADAALAPKADWPKLYGSYEEMAAAQAASECASDDSDDSDDSGVMRPAATERAAPRQH